MPVYCIWMSSLIKALYSVKKIKAIKLTNSICASIEEY